MQLVVADRQFEGPIIDAAGLASRSGVYIVVKQWHDGAQVLLVQEARMVKEAAKIWLPEIPSIQPFHLAVYVHYTPTLNVFERRRLADLVRYKLSSRMPTLPNGEVVAPQEQDEFALAT